MDDELDDAQAMALLKKFPAWVSPVVSSHGALCGGWKVEKGDISVIHKSLNRAIREFVAITTSRPTGLP